MVQGEKFIYLDHSATSWPKPEEVLQAVSRALCDLTANAGRSGHAPSIASARMLFETRQLWADLLGVKASERLIFTPSCTAGLNLVLKGVLGQGGRVIVSPLEHNSVMRPLARLAKERGVRYQTLPSDRYGRVDAQATEALVEREGPFDLAVVAHACNANGAVQDLVSIRRALRGTKLLVDAAQSVGVLPIDVAAMGIDYLCCSGHKGLLGPTGTGACYLGEGLDIEPLIEGGTGSHSDSMEQPSAMPDRYESGTQNLHGIAGIHAALAGIGSRGLLGTHKQELAAMLIEGIGALPGVRVHSPSDGTALCCAFTIDDVRTDVIAKNLQESHGILCRPGLQCAPAAHRHMGTFPGGTVRLSPGWGTTETDVRAAIRALREIAAGGS